MNLGHLNIAAAVAKLVADLFAPAQGPGSAPALPGRKQPGAGVQRQAARLAAKRRRNAAIPDADVWTRQRRRAEERRVAKL